MAKGDPKDGKGSSYEPQFSIKVSGLVNWDLQVQGRQDSPLYPAVVISARPQVEREALKLALGITAWLVFIRMGFHRVCSGKMCPGP
ncbi:Hypothetical protein NTJ_07404 [Nesidiocoris tenuis]|uniref:Uncharacterized protein n=1 Tax=Nesidiocoris tenuis TaxID=355587 RepID=A0ABN7AQW4_9HEMI|nr:Hypothetical protein NTJ_07404 [Nesidiocoris tenuis]